MFSQVMRAIRHPKAMQELGLALMTIQQEMKDGSVSREEKREALSIVVDGLSEGTYNLSLVAEQIMTIINMEREVCEEYANTEEQVEGILKWLPRFKTHRKLLFDKVKKQRAIYGLET